MRHLVVAAILATIAAAAIKEQLMYVDDADAAVDYWTPSGTWNVGTGSGLYQNSFTFSDVEGATITWRFRGTHVDYWGVANENGGLCLVTLDGINQTISTNGPEDEPSILLYQRSELDPEVEHTVVITVSSNVCNLDRFAYIPAVNAPHRAGTIFASSSSSSSGDGVAIAKIIGFIIAAMVACAILYGLYLLLR